MNRRLNIAAVLAIALVSGVSACGGGGGNKMPIGASLPLSGAYSVLGPPGQKAAELAADQINNAASAAGTQQVKLVTADSGSSTSSAVKASRDLAGNGAHCIAGPWGSVDAIAAANAVTIPRRILVISPAASDDNLTTFNDHGLVSRTVLPNRAEGPALAQVIADSLGGAGGKVVNVGARADSYGSGIAAAFTKAWTSDGGLIGARVDYAVGQPDYSSVARRITSGHPDATVIADRTDNFPSLGRALAATGKWDPKKAFGTDGLANNDLVKDPGPKVTRGMQLVFPGSPNNTAATKAYDKLFDSSDPTDVKQSAFDAQNFDAVILCDLASVAARSAQGKQMAAELPRITDPSATHFSWQQLPSAVKELKRGKSIDYVGASGELNINSKGDRTAGVYDLLAFKPDLVRTGDVVVSGPR